MYVTCHLATRYIHDMTKNRSIKSFAQYFDRYHCPKIVSALRE